MTSLLEQVFSIYDHLAEPWHAYFEQNFGVSRVHAAAEFAALRPSGPMGKVSGFEEFGNRQQPQWIAPGNPALSVFYHALASPSVEPAGLAPTDYPDDDAIETVEDYIFASAGRSLNDVRDLAGGAPLAIAVFAKQYRVARETTHHLFADFVFSRLGVSRVGNSLPPNYDGPRRCYAVHNQDPRKANVLPCRFSAYLAAKVQGSAPRSIPGRFRPGDDSYQYWVPVHKLFGGGECLRDYDNLEIELTQAHCNEKLRRVQRALQWLGAAPGHSEPEISASPFVESALLSAFQLHSDQGSALLVPMDKIVEPALDSRGQPVTLNVPPNTRNTDSSFHIFPLPLHWAPEFVYVRQRYTSSGTVDLNAEFDVNGIVRQGNYQAVHFRDFTADGWIRAECPQLGPQVPLTIAAYSVVAPPDLMPNLRQSDLMDWYENAAPADIKSDLWEGSSPQPLCDQRTAANLDLPGAHFTTDDLTVAALVGFAPGPPDGQPRLATGAPDIFGRTTALPDDASGIFAPGSEISQDQTPPMVSETGDSIPPVPFLTNYGMGSPFLEDTKLCAAQSSFWPGTTPDTARVFEPHFDQPTVTPLLDTELAWDGSTAPAIVAQPAANKAGQIRVRSRSHADYVTQFGKFDFSLLEPIDIVEYTQRTIAMARVYQALDAPIMVIKGEWMLFSFTRPDAATLTSDTGGSNSPSPTPIATPRTYNHPAQPTLSPLAGPGSLTGAEVRDAVQGASQSTYRFQMCRYTGKYPDDTHIGTYIVTFQEILTIYANPRHVYIQRNTQWDHFAF